MISRKHMFMVGLLYLIRKRIYILLLIGAGACSTNSNLYESPYVEILFLGHNSEHHHSERFMPMLASEVLTRGIHFTYSSDPDDLNKENLEKYDGLALYANYDTITAVQEEALLDFVKSGKGFIPIHAASFCFRNSDDFVEMLGGQFKQHGEGTFTSELTPTGKNHAIPVYEFETWDETYVHHKINPSINILMERVEDGHREPYTWTNNYGGGRIFYTAYGHDERTWSNPGFHDLMAEGILWAVGDRAAAKAAKLQFPVVEYTEARIPNYEKRDPPLKLQQPLSPQASMQLSQVPVGFELTLYASEPDIINPIAFSWDEKGRLWVIETVDYPNTVRTEDGVGDDRIKICEDTDGDGKADKFTIFADDLNIPTSMVFANDGVIVSQAPYFLFLQDTDGDDRADVREVVSSGWGVSDTHAGPSNLRYGFDNKIWGTIGYSAFDGVVDGVPTRFSSGVFRFNPDGTALEHVAATTNNTWGLGFSENFDVFASTANNNHSVHLGIYNGYLDGVKGLPQNLGDKIDGHYAMHPITQQVRQVDVFGGFTAAAGHSLYTARNFPKNYWNSIAFVCEPTGRLVHNAVLKQDGSGFREEDGWNLVASNDNWFGPVQAEVGPDGAVWIADWYNFIIQHNPTPPGFENGPGNAHINPLRDRKHGRIYRLAYQGAKQYRPVSLSKDDKNGLIQSLQNDNLLWRLTAQRLLVERGEKDVVPDLMNLIASQQVDDLGISPGAIHALWILHGLQVINGQMEQEIFDVVTDALKHTSAGVRKAAVQVLPGTERAAVALLSSGVLKDPNKNTQLAAILALSKMPSVDGVGEILLELSLDKDLLSDDLLSKSVYIAATRHKSDFLSALTSDKEASDRLADQLQQLKDPWEIDLDLTNWGVVEVPGMLEKTEIGEVDGTFWFRKEIDLNSSNKNRVGKIHLGAIRQTDETWVNGVKVGSTQDSWNKKRVYDIPAGLLKQGRNVVAVKVINNHFDGGFAGKPEDIRLEFAGGVIPLAGAWRYYIEHILTENYFSETNSIARNLLINYPSDGAPDPQVNEQEIPEDAILVDIKVIENEMKYDVEGFEVEAGKEVVIRFRNTDFMQHNLVIADQGSLEVVGEAADQMATSADGAAMNYVPEISQVLHATGLVDPRTEVVLRFTAPEEPGEYPFVCTFPGHWRIMNGVMKVVAPKIEAL